MNHIFMNDIQKFLQTPTKSSAQIINDREVEVIAPDGEVFTLNCPIGRYFDETYKNYQLHWLEILFDKYHSPDREMMFRNILSDSMVYGNCPINGVSVGTWYLDRARIGARIREMREERDMEAKELAKLAGIDASNLSRIENGKYSVGFDVLSKIAAALGKKVDFVDF